MELKVKKEKVVALAKECPQCKDGLKKLFPEAFELDAEIEIMRDFHKNPLKYMKPHWKDGSGVEYDEKIHKPWGATDESYPGTNLPHLISHLQRMLESIEEANILEDE